MSFRSFPYEKAARTIKKKEKPYFLLSYPIVNNSFYSIIGSGGRD